MVVTRGRILSTTGRRMAPPQAPSPAPHRRTAGSKNSTIDRSARNMSWAMVISAIVVGSSILVLANRGDTFDGLSIVGLAGYLAAATLGLWRLWRDHASRK